MARITFKGLEEYDGMLAKFSKDLDKICGRATYAGAKVIADEIKARIEALPVVNGFGSPEHPLPGGVTQKQKQGLIDSFGISGLQNDDGYYNVKLGFDGYNDVRTKAYPNGQPNQLVARGAESGTSWKQKSPFVRPAVTAKKSEAETAMANVLDEEIEKRMK